MQVRLRPESRHDIYHASRFYDQQSPGLGDHFVKCIFEDLQRLEGTAGIHAKHHDYFRIFSEKFPFIICYILSDDVVDVVAVLSCRMKPQTISKELINRKSNETEI